MLWIWKHCCVFLYAGEKCGNLAVSIDFPLHFVNFPIRSVFLLLFSVLCVCGTIPLRAAMPTISLAEIKPGMKGVWHTVVTGTKVEEFPLEVIGISQNFAGPQRAVIICQALDPTNLLSGPVAGMSGSPVYIEGKLAGAYAYGYLWPKNKP